MIIYCLLTGEETRMQRVEIICLIPWLENGRARTHLVCLTTSVHRDSGVLILALPKLTGASCSDPPSLGH